MTELNEIELDLWFLILAIAGSETTRNAIAIGLKTLLEHPEEMERLRAHPELIDTAVDEIIRWSSPVLYHRRIDRGRHRAARRAPGRRPPDHHVLARRQPRRAGLRRPVPVRPRAHAERPRGLRWGRAALLPRRQPGQARGEGDAGRAAVARRRPRLRHGRPTPGECAGRCRAWPCPSASGSIACRSATRCAADRSPPALRGSGSRRQIRTDSVHICLRNRDRSLRPRQICTDSVDICLSGARLSVGADRARPPMFALRIPAASASPGLPRRSGGIGRRASLRG